MRTVFCFVFAACLALGAAFQIEALSENEQLAHAYFKQFLGVVSDAIEGKHTEQLFDDIPTGLDYFGEHVGRQKRWAQRVSNSFKFENCANTSHELVVPSKVSLKPDPIKLPGNVTAGGSVTIKQALNDSLKAVLDIQYEIWPDVWVKVPCLGNIGSCTYEDVCKNITIEQCPPEIEKIGLTCQCPFPAGDFTVDSLKLFIGASIPISAHIKVQATVSRLEKLVTCVKIELNVA